MLSFGQGQDSEAITYRRRHSFDASYPELLFFESRFKHLRNRDAVSWIGRRATEEGLATVPRLGQAFQRLFRQMAGDDWQHTSTAFLTRKRTSECRRR
jgi:hypothetical protein